MSQHIYEYPCNYIIGPHVMFHGSQSYSTSKSMPLRSPVWEYFKIVGEKKVRSKLCMPPATSTLCVCMRACVLACVCTCVHAVLHASLYVCVCTLIIQYSIVKEANI